MSPVAMPASSQAARTALSSSTNSGIRGLSVPVVFAFTDPSDYDSAAKGVRCQCSPQEVVGKVRPSSGAAA